MPAISNRLRHILLCSSFVFAATFAWAQQPPSTPIVLHAARLLQVDTGNLLQPGEVLVDGDRIRAVGKSVEHPQGAKVIDLGDTTLLPGLIDAHIHLFLHPGAEDLQTVVESVPWRTILAEQAAKADVMAGFPAESEAEFEQTRAFIERLPFTYLHIFPYSERPGTPAAESSAQVPWPKRKERGRILKSLGQKKNLEFRRSMIGRTLSAVTLGNAEAITSNYLAVELATARPARQLTDLKIGTLTETALREENPLAVLR